ncbi:L-asparagine oxygenase [Marinomonas spartinae]|uniref:L-asparagine oxygenase n=1 Tax=Marinomonas spartinae TaxID=1792290 RepID=A0A1A8TAE7_9GAMM|nr:TauD/TfdA family dioxygenase [Marinomonas spartinae]SBS28463.1 L-asparagine oxygenase [Marinomonas spartinae]
MHIYKVSKMEQDFISSYFENISKMEINKESIDLAKRSILSVMPGLSKLREDLDNGFGVIKFESLPIGDAKEFSPPQNGIKPEDKSNFSELVLLGVTSALGLNPFSYQNEKNGALVHEIVPIMGMEKSISSNGIDSFDFHTDGAYLERHMRPHALSLLCLSNESNTPTNIVNLEQCLDKLNEKDIDLLSKRLFIHHAPETFSVKNGVCHSSVVDRVDGKYEVKGAMHNTKAINEEANESLLKLSSLTSKYKIESNWNAGDLVVFSNLRVLHGRGKISGKRWLQRCYSSFSHNAADVITLK